MILHDPDLIGVYQDPPVGVSMYSPVAVIRGVHEPPRLGDLRPLQGSPACSVVLRLWSMQQASLKTQLLLSADQLLILSLYTAHRYSGHRTSQESVYMFFTVELMGQVQHISWASA